MSIWQMPDEPAAIAILDGHITYLLLGIYGWEYLQSLCVEYSFIRGRLRFRLSVIPYIVGRVFTLVYLLVLAVGMSPLTDNISCKPSVFITYISVDVALGCSSAIFMIRAWLIWKDSRWIHVLLVVLALGQWTIMVYGISLLRLIDTDGLCMVYFDHTQVNAAAFIYVTICDLFVFALSVVGLSKQRSQSPLTKRLQKQGIFYSAIVGIAYIPPAVFALLHNTFLFTFFSSCGVVISTIASSRAMRSLLSLDTSSPSQAAENHMEFTTHIAIQSSTTRIHEDSNAQSDVDKADLYC